MPFVIWLAKAGNTVPQETEEKVKTIAANGGTPLVVAVITK